MDQPLATLAQSIFYRNHQDLTAKLTALQQLKPTEMQQSKGGLAARLATLDALHELRDAGKMLGSDEQLAARALVAPLEPWEQRLTADPSELQHSTDELQQLCLASPQLRADAPWLAARLALAHPYTMWQGWGNGSDAPIKFSKFMSQLGMLELQYAPALARAFDTQAKLHESGQR